MDESKRDLLLIKKALKIAELIIEFHILAAKGYFKNIPQLIRLDMEIRKIRSTKIEDLEDI